MPGINKCGQIRHWNEHSVDSEGDFYDWPASQYLNGYSLNYWVWNKWVDVHTFSDGHTAPITMYPWSRTFNEKAPSPGDQYYTWKDYPWGMWQIDGGSGDHQANATGWPKFQCQGFDINSNASADLISKDGIYNGTTNTTVFWNNEIYFLTPFPLEYDIPYLFRDPSAYVIVPDDFWEGSTNFVGKFHELHDDHNFRAPLDMVNVFYQSDDDMTPPNQNASWRETGRMRANTPPINQYHTSWQYRYHSDLQNALGPPWDELQFLQYEIDNELPAGKIPSKPPHEPLTIPHPPGNTYTDEYTFNTTKWVWRRAYCDPCNNIPSGGTTTFKFRSFKVEPLRYCVHKDTPYKGADGLPRYIPPPSDCNPNGLTHGANREDLTNNYWHNQCVGNLTAEDCTTDSACVWVDRVPTIYTNEIYNVSNQVESSRVEKRYTNSGQDINAYAYDYIDGCMFDGYDNWNNIPHTYSNPGDACYDNLRSFCNTGLLEMDYKDIFYNKGEATDASRWTKNWEAITGQNNDCADVHYYDEPSSDHCYQSNLNSQKCYDFATRKICYSTILGGNSNTCDGLQTIGNFCSVPGGTDFTPYTLPYFTSFLDYFNTSDLDKYNLIDLGPYNDFNLNNIPLLTGGCTYENALNYGHNMAGDNVLQYMIDDDGACLFEGQGCQDDKALDYSPSAVFSATCTYAVIDDTGGLTTIRDSLDRGGIIFNLDKFNNLESNWVDSTGNEIFRKEDGNSYNVELILYNKNDTEISRVNMYNFSSDFYTSEIDSLIDNNEGYTNEDMYKDYFHFYFSLGDLESFGMTINSLIKYKYILQEIDGDSIIQDNEMREIVVNPEITTLLYDYFYNYEKIFNESDLPLLNLTIHPDQDEGTAKLQVFNRPAGVKNRITNAESEWNSLTINLDYDSLDVKSFEDNSQYISHNEYQFTYSDSTIKTLQELDYFSLTGDTFTLKPVINDKTFIKDDFANDLLYSMNNTNPSNKGLYVELFFSDEYPEYNAGTDIKKEYRGIYFLQPKKEILHSSFLSGEITSGPETLLINEVMASNDSTETTPGMFDDWIELYNNSPDTINLSDGYWRIIDKPRTGGYDAAWTIPTPECVNMYDDYWTGSEDISPGEGIFINGFATKGHGITSTVTNPLGDEYGKADWVEIFNNSGDSIDLKDYKIADAAWHESGEWLQLTESFIIPNGGYAIIVADGCNVEWNANDEEGWLRNTANHCCDKTNDPDGCISSGINWLGDEANIQINNGANGTTQLYQDLNGNPLSVIRVEFKLGKDDAIYLIDASDDSIVDYVDWSAQEAHPCGGNPFTRIIPGIGAYGPVDYATGAPALEGWHCLDVEYLVIGGNNLNPAGPPLGDICSGGPNKNMPCGGQADDFCHYKVDSEARIIVIMNGNSNACYTLSNDASASVWTCEEIQANESLSGGGENPILFYDGTVVDSIDYTEAASRPEFDDDTGEAIEYAPGEGKLVTDTSYARCADGKNYWIVLDNVGGYDVTFNQPNIDLCPDIAIIDNFISYIDYILVSELSLNKYAYMDEYLNFKFEDDFISDAFNFSSLCESYVNNQIDLSSFEGWVLLNGVNLNQEEWETLFPAYKSILDLIVSDDTHLYHGESLTFFEILLKRYNELRSTKQLLDIKEIQKNIELRYESIEKSFYNDYNRWSYNDFDKTYTLRNKVDELKTWIKNRIHWIDHNIRRIWNNTKAQLHEDNQWCPENNGDMEYYTSYLEDNGSIINFCNVDIALNYNPESNFNDGLCFYAFAPRYEFILNVEHVNYPEVINVRLNLVNHTSGEEKVFDMDKLSDIGFRTVITDFIKIGDLISYHYTKLIENVSGLETGSIEDDGPRTVYIYDEQTKTFDDFFNNFIPILNESPLPIIIIDTDRNDCQTDEQYINGSPGYQGTTPCVNKWYCPAPEAELEMESFGRIIFKEGNEEDEWLDPDNNSNYAFYSARAECETNTICGLYNIPCIDGYTIQDEPKVAANMKIIYNGENSNNKTTDTPNSEHKIGIEIRGFSHRGFSKKQFSIELQHGDIPAPQVKDKELPYSLFCDGFKPEANKDYGSLCYFPFEEDFVILGPYRDKTMMKNAMTYEMWRQMDFDRPNITTKYVELVVNGSYKGVYVFMEKVKIGKSRVNLGVEGVKSIPLEDGGDIAMIKVESGAEQEYFISQDGHTKYEYYEPEFSDLTPDFEETIKKTMYDTENSIFGKYRSSLMYEDYINTSDFLDYILLQELSLNREGYTRSHYWYWDTECWDFSNSEDCLSSITQTGRVRCGWHPGTTSTNPYVGNVEAHCHPKIYLGPVWDFNHAYGGFDAIVDEWAMDSYKLFQNSFYRQWFGSEPTLDGDYTLDTAPEEGPSSGTDLVRKYKFVEEIRAKYQQYRQSGVFNLEWISEYIETVYKSFKQNKSIDRDSLRWYKYGRNFDEEIIYFKTWIFERLKNLDIGETFPFSSGPLGYEEIEPAIYSNEGGDFAYVIWPINDSEYDVNELDELKIFYSSTKPSNIIIRDEFTKEVYKEFPVSVSEFGVDQGQIQEKNTVIWNLRNLDKEDLIGQYEIITEVKKYIDNLDAYALDDTVKMNAISFRILDIPINQGCTDIKAINFDIFANEDDGTCIFYEDVTAGIITLETVNVYSGPNTLTYPLENIRLGLNFFERLNRAYNTHDCSTSDGDICFEENDTVILLQGSYDTELETGNNHLTAVFIDGEWITTGDYGLDIDNEITYGQGFILIIQNDGNLIW